MKKMMESFESNTLSRTEMKNVSAGYACQAGNLVSNSFRASSLAAAQSMCNASSYCKGWGGGGCTAIVT